QLDDQGKATLDDEKTLDSGVTDTQLQLEPGGKYRVIVGVLDRAGNEATETVLFAVSPDAKDAGGSGCGCVVGQGTGKGECLWGLMGLVAALAVAHRRRPS